jgi:hypothetical protein
VLNEGGLRASSRTPRDRPRGGGFVATAGGWRTWGTWRAVRGSAACSRGRRFR